MERVLRPARKKRFCARVAKPDAPKYRRSVEALAAAVEQRELRRGYEARLISEWERQAQGEAAGRAQQEQEEAEYAMADRLEEGRACGKEEL